MTEYLVISRSNGTTKTGSPFCTLKLKNLEEELQIAVWDVKPTDEPIVGQTVSFFAIQDNGDKKSARKLDMHPGMVPQEGHPLYHLVPRPIKRALWDECINHLLSLCKDETLKPLITEFADVLFKPYSLYPAATSVHHAFKGGLLNHTYQMLHMLEGIYPVLPYNNVKLERCILAILFHDYGKVYEYNKEGEPQQDMYLLGHIFISANRLQAELLKHNVPAEETNRIVHVVLSHHGELEYGSPIVPATAEAILVNHLDNLSAKLDVIETTGNMEKAFALGTHVIKNER